MTLRDLRILNFINRFGKCNVEHVARFFDVSNVRAYQILNRLKREGMLSYQRVFHNEPGVYMCTSEGARNTPHDKIRDFNIASLKHDLKIIDVFLEHYKNSEFKTEREIRCDKELEHFADMLISQEDKQISLEIEFSRKSKQRMEEIKNFYLKSMDIDAVHYFVPGELVGYISNVFNGLEMFQINEL